MQKIIYVILLLSHSCVVPTIELSDEESELAEKLNREYKCDDIYFRHDYFAVSKNSNEGSFVVSLCPKFCKLDSIELVNVSIEIAQSLKPILSHKEHYTSISFYTSIEVDIDELTSKSVCNKKIQVELNNLNLIEYY